MKQPTSLNIDSVLWKKIKIEAIERGITLTELVEYALRKEIRKESDVKRNSDSKLANQDITTTHPSSTSRRSTISRSVHLNDIWSTLATEENKNQIINEPSSLKVVIPSVMDQTARLNTTIIPSVMDQTARLNTTIIPSVMDQTARLNTTIIPSVEIAKAAEESHKQLINNLDNFRNQIITTVSGTTMFPNLIYDINSAKKKNNPDNSNR
jgi:hypothetical protein